MRAFRIFFVLVLLTLAGGCTTVGHTVEGVNNFDQVSPTLYRGAQPTAEGIRMLAAKQIQTVINLRDDGDPAEALLVEAAGMTYVVLPQDATKVTLSDAERFLTALKDAKGPVFVHCHAGRDRTGLAIAAYRVSVDHWSAQQAIDEMYAHGHYWFVFPKVRATVRELASRPPEKNGSAQAAAAPKN